MADLESPLDPFQKDDGGRERAYTSLDCINIDTQLGYTYRDTGSLTQSAGPHASEAAVPPGHRTTVIRVSALNRATIRGSFLVSAYARIEGKKHHLGTEAVLSRWHVAHFANCQTHLEVKAFIPLHRFLEASIKDATFEVEGRTRDGLLTDGGTPAAARALPTLERKPFRVDVR